MVSNKKPTDIVYCYNWKGLIMVKRTRGGKWSYDFSIVDIFDNVNKNRSEDPTLGPPLKKTFADMFTLGQIFQYKITELLHYCRQSYGDPEIHRDSHVYINRVLVDPVDLADELANILLEEKFIKLGITKEHLYHNVLGTNIPREQYLSFHNESANFFNDLIRKFSRK